MNGSPSMRGGIGLGDRGEAGVEVDQQDRDHAYVAGMPTTRSRAARRRAEDRAGLADAAQRRDAAGRLVARHDLGLEGGQRRPLEAAREPVRR